MGRPALAERPDTLAGRGAGERAELAERTPIRGDGWVEAGTVVLVTGKVSGDWTFIRFRHGEGAWSPPYAVPDTTRIRAVVA